MILWLPSESLESSFICLVSRQGFWPLLVVEWLCYSSNNNKHHRKKYSANLSFGTSFIIISNILLDVCVSKCLPKWVGTLYEDRCQAFMLWCYDRDVMIDVMMTSWSCDDDASTCTDLQTVGTSSLGGNLWELILFFSYVLRLVFRVNGRSPKT